MALRYYVLGGAALLIWRLRYELISGDFAFFEYFGRTALHRPGYGGGWHQLLHVYTDMPKMQIGPPPMLLATPLMQLNGPHSNKYAVLLMMLAVVPCIWLAERAARAWGADRERTRPAALLLGAAVLPLWSDVALWYQHLDDILIIALTFGAVWAAGRDRWMLAAALIGTATATKPWAIALVPLLLAAPRARRAPVMLMWICAFAIWWVPFLLADSQTFVALGSANVPVEPGSVYALFGIHGKAGTNLCQDSAHCLRSAYHWMRPVQFALSIAAGALAVRRRRLLAAPLVGLTVRVLLDSQIWPYYGVGPVLMAGLWDLSKGRRFPRWALLVMVADYASVAIGSTTAQAIFRLVGGLVVLGWFLRPASPRPEVPAQRTDVEPERTTDAQGASGSSGLLQPGVNHPAGGVDAFTRVLHS
ncbi:MAG TPA: glycosyltransferase 87 family protein [Mycobacteriales bacterium]|nr:glycosyltransferase 87 family protein [Mycobacteriales bacterium]